MITIATMATNVMAVLVKFALIKTVTSWLYEYDIHSVINGVSLLKYFTIQHVSVACKFNTICINYQRINIQISSGPAFYGVEGSSLNGTI